MTLLFIIVYFKGTVIYVNMDEKYPAHKCYDEAFRTKVALEQMDPNIFVKAQCFDKGNFNRQE